MEGRTGGVRATEDDHRDVLATVRAARRALLVRGWLPSDGPARWRRYAVAGAVLVGLVVLGIVAFARGEPAVQSPPPLPAAVARAPGTLPAAAASSASPGSSSGPSSAARPTTVVVAVVGRVGHAGLVRLPDGARVADAVGAAGGPLPGVDLTNLNLARKVNDGEQLFVGVPIPSWALPAAGAVPPPAAPPPAPDGGAGSGGVGSGGAGSAGAGAPGGKVALNTANAAQLDQLPGVGEITAKHIVDWRTQHGRFTSVDQLKDVPGIGDGKFSKLKDQVTLG